MIESVCEWLQQGESVWFCTIVKTWGASPRPAGSLLAFHPEFGIVGSLSGGCIEEALIRQLASSTQSEVRIQCPFTYEYEITLDDKVRYSLPCGGQLTILVEHLTADSSTLLHFSSILEALNERRLVRRRVALDDGDMTILASGGDNVGAAVELSTDAVVSSLGPSFKMLILGAGEVSRYVAQMANTVDFSVTICEPRESYLKGFQPDHVSVVQCLPDDLIREQFSDPYCAILALAHDPRVDDMALLEATKTPAFYVGAMGSLRTTRARVVRLASLGCATEELNKLHAPIGFDIGSKKPAEIAISILAEVLAERHRFVAAK